MLHSNNKTSFLINLDEGEEEEEEEEDTSKPPLFCVLFCSVLLCYVMLCYVMLCYVLHTNNETSFLINLDEGEEEEEEEEDTSRPPLFCSVLFCASKPTTTVRVSSREEEGKRS